MLDVSRRELKYLIDRGEMYRMRPQLATVLAADAHGGQDGYRVRSLYFDSLFDSDFEDKVDGYDDRRKIRLRVYDAKDATVKLELKEKTGSAQRKRSLLLSREEAERMIRGDYLFLMERPESLAKQLYPFLTTKCYRPKCIVEYDRMAYYRSENDIRVTFDQNLRASEASFDLFDEALILYPVAHPNEVTLEVKYRGFLYSHVKELISRTDRMQTSNSKYCRARNITKRGRR